MVADIYMNDPSLYTLYAVTEYKSTSRVIRWQAQELHGMY